MKTTMKTVILIITFVSVNAFFVDLPSDDGCTWEENPVEMFVFNFQEKAIFPTTSSLLYSDKDAVLFDAQFSLKEANKIVRFVQNINAKLRLIIITCGDPDYYFGLQAIVEAFPSVEIVASPKVANYINQTKDAKLNFWGSKLAHNAPNELYVPKPIDRDMFHVDNKKEVRMMEMDSYAAYVWIPEDKMILGGVGIYSGIHVWTADTPTPEMRLNWRKVLQKMIDLEPQVVIPGHFIGKRQIYDDGAIRFTLKYLETLEKILEQNNYKNSTAVINYMKEKFLGLGLESNLELGAKVLTGEMKL
ncbi:uncharacterized protein LOC135843833 [Planococcus citri]|uniref:uncharacterized protein LOC135843833 n=1 Tax=Planococcus citri TaxID=170843 RepID=UPI0031F7798A